MLDSDSRAFVTCCVERFRELVGRRLLILTASRRRVEVEFVLLDDERHPRRHRGDQPREPSKRHRLRMRLPVITTERHMLERAAGARGFTIEFVEKQLREFIGTPGALQFQATSGFSASYRG